MSNVFVPTGFIPAGEKNNNNNIKNYVYSAIIIAQPLREFNQPVHLMNVGQRQAAADPQTKLTDLGCESTSTPTIIIYY